MDSLMIVGGILLSLLVIALASCCDGAMACKVFVSLAQCAVIDHAIRKTGSAWCLLAMLCLAVIW